MSLKEQLSISENGGVYYEGMKVDPTSDPVLFVGLGGTGIDALLRIKNQIQTRMPLPRTPDGRIIGTSPEHIAFLAVDTASSSYQNKRYGVASFSATGEDSLSIAVDGLPAVIRSIVEKHLEEPAWNWYDPHLSGVGGVQGANGIRQIGRFMLFHNIANVRQKMETVITRIVQKAGELPRSNGPMTLRIFLLTGIAGGTGSGIFLDMAYLLRDAARRLNQNTVEVHGYLFTPDLNSQNGGNILDLNRNGFAALKELDYWMSIEEHPAKQFTQDYPDGSRIQSPDKPFDFCHIITGQNFNGNLIPYLKAVDIVSGNLFNYIVRETTDGVGNSAIKEMYDNIGGYEASKAKPAPACYKYLSVGSAQFEIPYTEMTTYLGTKVFQKLEPMFRREPDDASFNEDMARMGLTWEGLHDYMLEDVTENPLLYQTYNYPDIWKIDGSEPDPLGVVLVWLEEHAKRAVEKAGESFVSDHEEKFREYMKEVIADTEKGPSYAVKLVQAPVDRCVVSRLESYIKTLDENIITQKASIATAQNDYDNKYANGWKAGPFGKKRATAAYLEALNTLCELKLEYAVAVKEKEAVGKLKDRIKKYYTQLFEPLGENLRILPGVFRDNGDVIRANEEEAQRNPDQAPKRLITATEFAGSRQDEISRVIDTISVSFTQMIRDNLRQWTGFELDNIDASAAETDAYGAVVSFISGQFHESLTNDMSMQALLKRKEPTRDPDEIYREKLNKLQSDAVPLFKPDVTQRVQTESFSMISIPRNCEELFNTANSFRNPTDSLKKSSEEGKLQWVKVTAGYPLFAFPKIDEMERFYEEAMAAPDTAKGAHLNRAWREEMPSPLPEDAWPENLKNEPQKKFSREFNEKVRAAFDACLKCGAIKKKSDSEMVLYIADSETLGSVKLTGSVQQKKNAVDRLKKELWSENNAESIVLKSYNSQRQMELSDKVRQNVLRFPDIAGKMEEQKQIADRIDKLAEDIDFVERYVDACFCGMIYSDEFDIWFKKAEEDISATHLMELFSNTESLDYDVYQALLPILRNEKAQAKENISSQFERIKTKMRTSPEEKEKRKERLGSLRARVERDGAVCREHYENMPIEQRKALREGLEFYSTALEFIDQKLKMFDTSASAF